MRPISRDQILRLAKVCRLHRSSIIKGIQPAVRGRASGTDTGPCRSRIGGHPDLPADLEWPCWDQRPLIEPAIQEVEENLEYYRSPRWLEPDPDGDDDLSLEDRLEWRDDLIRRAESRIEELRARTVRGPVPLAFLAQLDLSELVGLPHGLPLPEEGLLSFFYDMEEQPGGYSPEHKGGFRVIHTGAGEAVEEREAPGGFPSALVSKRTPVAFAACWSFPSEATVSEREYRKLDDRLTDFHFSWRELDPLPHHQVGGIENPVQNPMQESLCLVTRGVDTGGEVRISRVHAAVLLGRLARPVLRGKAEIPGRKRSVAVFLQSVKLELSRIFPTFRDRARFLAFWPIDLAASGL
jgi:hypothetical protein